MVGAKRRQRGWKTRSEGVIYIVIYHLQESSCQAKWLKIKKSIRSSNLAVSIYLSIIISSSIKNIIIVIVVIIIIIIIIIYSSLIHPKMIPHHKVPRCLLAFLNHPTTTKKREVRWGRYESGPLSRKVGSMRAKRFPQNARDIPDDGIPSDMMFFHDRSIGESLDSLGKNVGKKIGKKKDEKRSSRCCDCGVATKKNGTLAKLGWIYLELCWLFC